MSTLFKKHCQDHPKESAKTISITIWLLALLLMFTTNCSRSFPKHGTVTGQVSNTSGEVVSGATVRILGVSGLETTTNAQGTYTLTNVEQGKQVVIASHQDFEDTSASATVVVKPGTTVFASTIRLTSASNAFVLAWGSQGSGNGEFDGTLGIVASDAGAIYVADTGNHRVQKFDTSGNFVLTWGSSGSQNSQFNLPSAITTDASNNVYVADTGNQRIQKFDQNGTFTLKWGGFSTGAIAADGSGNLYAINSSETKIMKFNTSTGTLTTSWGAPGSGTGQLSDPSAISVDSSGNVYVADKGNNRIQKFNSEGTFLTQWPVTAPSGIAISGDNVYITLGTVHKVQKYDTAGTFITEFGKAGQNPGSFQFPSGITIDTDGSIYVVDTGNRRIQKFSGP